MNYLANIIQAAQDLTAPCSVDLAEYLALKTARRAGKIDEIEFRARLEEMAAAYDDAHRLRFWIEIARHEGALP